MPCDYIVNFPLCFQELCFGFFDISLQLGKEILDVLFMWNLNGLAGVNQRLLVKAPEPRGLFANVWLPTVYWGTRIP